MGWFPAETAGPEPVDGRAWQLSDSTIRQPAPRLRTGVSVGERRHNGGGRLSYTPMGIIRTTGGGLHGHRPSIRPNRETYFTLTFCLDEVVLLFMPLFAGTYQR